MRNGLTIEWTPSGHKGTATLMARLAGEVLAVETLNLTKPKARAEFAARLCKGRKGIARKALDAELLAAGCRCGQQARAGGGPRRAAGDRRVADRAA